MNMPTSVLDSDLNLYSTIPGFTCIFLFIKYHKYSHSNFSLIGSKM